MRLGFRSWGMWSRRREIFWALIWAGERQSKAAASRAHSKTLREIRGGWLFGEVRVIKGA